MKKQKKNYKKKNTKFFLQRKDEIVAKLFLRKSFTNIFLTLTDLRERVIYTLSGGMCALKNNKREKLAPFIVEVMTKKILEILNKFKIRNIEIIVRSFFRVHLRVLVYQLVRNNFIINVIKDRRIVPHNGVRGRALKRR